MPREDESVDDSIFADVKAAYSEVSDRVADTETPASLSPDAPAEQPAPAADGSSDDAGGDKAARAAAQPRDNGRFAKKQPDGKDKPEPAKADKVATEAAKDDKTAAVTEDKPEASQPAGGPPPSWTTKSKAAWDQLPAEVRADIAKRETEMARGLVELRDYKDLKPFAEMARKHNTTIAAALKNYTGIEALLRKDIGAGLAQIAQNFGLDQAKAAQLFASLAQRYGAQPGAMTAPTPTPAGGQAPQPGDPLYNVLRPFLDPLTQQVKDLTTKLSSREEADRNASAQSLTKAIETFSGRPENRYFAELEETITRLFETGMVPLTGNHEGDLRTAYDIAAQMNPEVREALIEQRLRGQRDTERQKEQEAAAKARSASRSITGSRVPGTVTRPVVEANGHDDIEADVRAAYRMHAQH